MKQLLKPGLEDGATQLYSHGAPTTAEPLESEMGSIILSDGEFRYEAIEGWARLSEEIILGEAVAVAVGENDTLYVFTRGEHPLIVFNRQGDVIRTFGHGLFKVPHGLDIGPDGSLYCTDAGDHTVRRLTPEGKLLFELGVPHAPAPFMSGEPFCACTHTALSPRGDLYVSDGYGNACVHQFAPDGRLLKTWGRSGCAPGEFFLPHNIVCDQDGWLYVADRENHRVQVFDGEGRYETQWNNLHRPCALCHSKQGLFFVGELGPFLAPYLHYPNLGPRLVITDGEGSVLARLSAGAAGIGPGRFIAPHGIAIDSHGDLYVAEVSYSAWQWVFPDKPDPTSGTELAQVATFVIHLEAFMKIFADRDAIETTFSFAS